MTGGVRCLLMRGGTSKGLYFRQTGTRCCSP